MWRRLYAATAHFTLRPGRAVSMTRDVPAERLYGGTSVRAMKALPYAGQAHGT